MQVERRQKLREQGRVADGLVEPLADGGLEIDAQDGARRLIRGAHGQIRLERHHSGGQAREDHGETGALGFHRLLAAARFLAGSGQALRHVVEGRDEKTQLIARGQRQLGVVIAFRNGSRSSDEVLHGLHQALGREERAVDRGDQRHQHDEGQNQHEGRLERPAQLHEIRILSVRALHRVGELAQLLRHRIQGDQQPPAAAAVGVGVQRGSRANHIAAHRVGVQAHVGLAAPQLQHHLVGGGHGQRIHRTVGTGREDLRLSADDGELERRALAPLPIERADQLEIRAGGQSMGDRPAVCCRNSRTRTSSAACDSSRVSFRPWLTSSSNQLSMPRLMNCSEK